METWQALEGLADVHAGRLMSLADGWVQQGEVGVWCGVKGEIVQKFKVIWRWDGVTCQECLKRALRVYKKAGSPKNLLDIRARILKLRKAGEWQP